MLLAAWRDRRIITSPVPLHIPSSPAWCFPVHSPIFLFSPTKSSFSFFTLVSFIHTPSLHAPPSLQVFLTGRLDVEVRTLCFARTVTAGLNKRSFHPFIFNRKSQNGLEVFANTFLQQVMSYCAVLRLLPIWTGCGEDLLFFWCPFIPHHGEWFHVTVRSAIRGSSKTWLDQQSPEPINLFSFCFILDLSGTKTEMFCLYSSKQEFPGLKQKIKRRRRICKSL